MPWNTGQIGADSHCWKGGVGNLPYGPEFTKPLKQYIRARDNHTCQRCGKTQADEGRVLVVHHLDHDKMNNAPENLVAACQKCNVWASHHRDAPFVRSAICA